MLVAAEFQVSKQKWSLRFSFFSIYLIVFQIIGKFTFWHYNAFFARKVIRHTTSNFQTLLGWETSAFHSKYIYCNQPQFTCFSGQNPDSAIYLEKCLHLAHRDHVIGADCPNSNISHHACPSAQQSIPSYFTESRAFKQLSLIHIKSMSTKLAAFGLFFSAFWIW